MSHVQEKDDYFVHAETAATEEAKYVAKPLSVLQVS